MTEETKVTRIQWLDIAKGIAIILMVMGHSGIPGVLAGFIYAFHMPLFFIASGLTTQYSPLSVFIKKKSKGLLLPFVIYSAIVLLFKPFVLHKPFGEVLVNWIKFGWLGNALWFVPVLFLSLLICRAINKISNKWVRISFCCLLPILSVLLKYNDIWLPWNFSTVPYAAFFVLLGSWIRPYSAGIISLYKKWYVYILLLAITLVISRFWNLGMAWNNCIPIIPITVGALSGTLLVFCLSKLIEDKCRYINKVFITIGKETFAIMALSQLIIQTMNEYFTIPFLVKYIFLVIILTIIVVVKNYIINRIESVPK